MSISKIFAFVISLSAASTAPLPDSLSGLDVLNRAPITVSEGEKGLVVAFLSARCPCSHSHIPELIDMAKAHPGFQFVAVHANGDEDATLTKTYFDGVKLPFPVIEDSKQEIADLFKAAKTPHVFVILKNGTVAFQGGMSDSKDCAKSTRKFLRDALEDIEAGRKVREPFVRTLGCSIARSSRAL